MKHYYHPESDSLFMAENCDDEKRSESPDSAVSAILQLIDRLAKVNDLMTRNVRKLKQIV